MINSRSKRMNQTLPGLVVSHLEMSWNPETSALWCYQDCTFSPCGMRKGISTYRHKCRGWRGEGIRDENQRTGREKEAIFNVGLEWWVEVYEKNKKTDKETKISLDRGSYLNQEQTHALHTCPGPGPGPISSSCPTPISWNGIAIQLVAQSWNLVFTIITFICYSFSSIMSGQF